MSDAPNDDPLYAALPDADLLKALAPYTAGGGGAPADAGRLRDVTRGQLVRCEVVRFTERRGETQRTAFGTKDLSALPLYEGALDDHPLTPPDEPGKVRDRLAVAARWRSHRTTADGSVPPGVHDAHRDAVAGHLARRKAELSRRVTLETCPLARVELTDDPNRVFHVFPGERSLEVVATLSNRLKRRLIAAGAVIVIVVVLILRLAS